MSNIWTDEARATLVEAAEVGLRQRDIAALLWLSERTLRRMLADDEDVRADYDAATARHRLTLARRLHAVAMGEAEAGRGAMTAIIFVLKTRGRWSEARDDPELDRDGREVDPLDPLAFLNDGAKPNDRDLIRLATEHGVLEP